MAPQTPSPRRRHAFGKLSRRRGTLLALMLGVVGCGPPDVEYIHVTEGSNGFVATSTVEYQVETPAEPGQLPSMPSFGEPESVPLELNPAVSSEPQVAVPPGILSDLNQSGPALDPAPSDSTLPDKSQPPLSLEQTLPQANPEVQKPRVVPLRGSVKPSPEPNPTMPPSQVPQQPLASRGEEPLDDVLLAYRTQARTAVNGLNTNELRDLNRPSQAQPELNSAAERAAQRVAAGSRLVERGATHSGRQEFIGALQVIAEALDQQRHTNAHARALEAGLTALQEAGDFVPSNPQRRLPLGELILGHQTTILQDVALDQLSNQDALRTYLGYAQQQLSTAGGDLLPGADALFALGKLHLLQSQQPDTSSPRLELERAIMLFHAALVIEPKHSLAANEAGVALARLGRLSEAKLALQHSASLTAHPSTWRNLASVHESLGEGQLAQLAQRESQTAKDRWQAQSQATGQLAHGSVQVVDNGAFAQAAPVNTFDNVANRGNPPAVNAPSPQNPAPTPAATQPIFAAPQVRTAPQLPWGQATPAAAPIVATAPQDNARTLR